MTKNAKTLTIGDKFKSAIGDDVYTITTMPTPSRQTRSNHVDLVVRDQNGTVKEMRLYAGARVVMADN